MLQNPNTDALILVHNNNLSVESSIQTALPLPAAAPSSIIPVPASLRRTRHKLRPLFHLQNSSHKSGSSSSSLPSVSDVSSFEDEASFGSTDNYDDDEILTTTTAAETTKKWLFNYLETRGVPFSHQTIDLRWVVEQESAQSTLVASSSQYSPDFAFSETPCPTSSVLGNHGSALESRIAAVLRELFPAQMGDGDDNSTSISLRRISGAMTNVIYQVIVDNSSNSSFSSSSTSMPPSPPSPTLNLLLRVYGSGVDNFVNRDKELLTTCRLSKLSVCPKLMGVFLNGRFEQFMDSVTLTKIDIRKPEISIKIAQELAKIHKLIDRMDADGSSSSSSYSSLHQQQQSIPQPELWDTLWNWLELAQAASEEIRRQGVGLDVATAVTGISNMGTSLEDEYFYIKQLASTTHSPVVFAHNDLQYGNIMELNQPLSPIMIVDYEYSGPNPRGFDIGNHFCEWAADYHSSTPHKSKYDGLFLVVLHSKPQSVYFVFKKSGFFKIPNCH